MANSSTSYSDFIKKNGDAVDATISRMAPRVKKAVAPATVPEQAPAQAEQPAQQQPASQPEEQEIGAHNAYGAIEPGNIDLSRRPHVMNPDGSVSTVRSMGVGFDGPDGKVKEYLIPTVSDDGHLLTGKQAIEQFKATGKHLGVYATPEESTKAALAIHRDQESHMPENTLETTAVAPNSGNLKNDIQTLTHEQAKTKNDTAASFVREGDAKAEASQQRADLLGQEAKAKSRYSEAAERVHDNNRARSDEAQKWLDDDMKTLRQPPMQPKAWQKTLGIVAGIVGATAQAYFGDLGNGIAYGLGELQSHMYKSVMDQLHAKEEAGHNLEHTNKYLDRLSKDSENEVDIAAKMAANHWLATSNALDEIAERAKVPEYKETAKRLAIGAKEQGIAIYKANAEKQLAAAQAAAKARAAAKTDWSRYSVAQLEAWERSNSLPGSGVEYLNNKIRKGASDLQKTAAETAKLQAGANPGAPGEIFPGYLQTQTLGAGADSKARSIYASGESIKQDLARLAEIREKNRGGTFNREDVKEAKAIISTLPSRYSQMFGSGAPNNTELELFGSYLTDPTDYQMTGLDPIESYKRLANQVDRTRDAQLAGFGIQPARGAERAGPPPDIRPRGEAAAQATAPDPNAPVPVLDMGTGRRYLLPPGRVAAAKLANPKIELVSDLENELKPVDLNAPKPPPPPPSKDEVFADAAYDTEEDERVRRRAQGLE